MKYLFVPVEGKIEVRDTEESDPYKIGKQDVGDWCERVQTHYRDINMFVDENGLMKRLPENKKVSGMLYPGPIFGDVVIVKQRTVYDEEGPTIVIIDMPVGTQRRLTSYLEGS
jgi:hypothetical protein